MKEKTTVGIITDATRGNLSYYGNPSWHGITAETVDGSGVFFNKTATDSSAGYEVGNALESWNFYKITHHTTRNGAKIIDYLEPAENNAALQLERINRLTEENNHTEAALYICRIFKDWRGERVAQAIERLEDAIGHTTDDLQRLRVEIWHAHAADLAELRKAAGQE